MHPLLIADAAFAYAVFVMAALWLVTGHKLRVQALEQHSQQGADRAGFVDRIHFGSSTNG